MALRVVFLHVVSADPARGSCWGEALAWGGEICHSALAFFRKDPRKSRGQTPSEQWTAPPTVSGCLQPSWSLL